MIRVATDLYRSELEWPFGNEVATCSYLLVHNHGNAIVFSSNRWREYEDDIRRLGEVATQYLNHRDEALPVFTSPQLRYEMIRSLRLIRGLDFDCMVPGLFIGLEERGDIHSMADFRSELDVVISRVESCEMH